MKDEEAILGRVRQMLAGLETGGDPREVLEAVLTEISEASQCESVGIRWRADEDYPYLATRGFGIEFIVRESPLCDRDSAGLVIRHADGTPQLACMCGAIIQGRTDPSLPFFTEGGSFWTNGSSAIAAEPPPSALRINLRAYCVTVGYDSVALIPLRADGQIHGLLQLNSHSPNRFTKERIEAYEQVAGEIARAVVRYVGQQ